MKVKLLILTLSLLILTGFAYQQVQRFDVIYVKKLVLQSGGATFQSALDMSNNAAVNIGAAGTDFGTDGSLTTAAGVTVSAGGLTLSDGNAVIADFTRIVSQTVLTMTDNGVITPTGSYQSITAAATTAGTLGGCAASIAGARVTIVNAVAQAITITDTGNTVLSGNAVLNQYDTLVVLCDGTRWIQLGKTDN